MLSMNLNTGLDFFLGLSLFELFEICEEVKEINDSIEAEVRGRRTV